MDLWCVPFGFSFADNSRATDTSQDTCTTPKHRFVDNSTLELASNPYRKIPDIRNSGRTPEERIVLRGQQLR